MSSVDIRNDKTLNYVLESMLALCKSFHESWSASIKSVRPSFKPFCSEIAKEGAVKKANFAPKLE